MKYLYTLIDLNKFMIKKFSLVLHVHDLDISMLYFKIILNQETSQTLCFSECI